MAIDLNRSASMPTDEVVELSGNEKHNEKHSQSKGDMVSVSLDDDVNAEVAHDLESRFDLGSKFDSLDQVYLIYCEYARVLGFSVRKGSQRYFDKTTEVRMKVFYCSCEGDPDNKRSNGRLAVYRKQVTRTQCKARLRVLREREGPWTVSVFERNHNHDLLNPGESYVLRSARVLTPPKVSILEALHAAGIPVTRACKFMEKESGGRHNVGFTRTDAYIHFRKKKSETRVENGDSQALLDFFSDMSKKEPFFYWRVKHDDDGNLKHFFFRDARAAVDYEYFGDVVSFDTTYKTNKYNMICAPFIGVNHHLHNVMFGLAFLSDETTETFEWLFSRFLDSMYGKEPAVIFSDQCQALMNGVDYTFENAAHRLCQWHINQNAPSHFGSLNGDKEFKKVWYKCMNWCETEDEFEELWQGMIAKYDLQSNRWFNTMYNLRRRWCSVFTNDKFCAGLHATSRSEVTNRILKDLGRRTNTLYDFVLRYMDIQKEWRERETAEDALCRGMPGQAVADNPFLLHAAKIFTRNVFKLIEFEATQSLAIRIVQHPADYSVDQLEFRVSSFVEDDRERVVSFNQRSLEIGCSCRMWECRGVFCRHAMKIIMVMEITSVPERYILQRLRRDCKRRRAAVQPLTAGSENCFEGNVFASHVMRTIYDMVYDAKGNPASRKQINSAINKLREDLRSGRAKEKQPTCEGNDSGVGNVRNPKVVKSRVKRCVRRNWRNFNGKGAKDSAFNDEKRGPHDSSDEMTSEKWINDYWPNFNGEIGTQNSIYDSNTQELSNVIGAQKNMAKPVPRSQDEVFYVGGWTRELERVVLMKLDFEKWSGNWVVGDTGNNKQCLLLVRQDVNTEMGVDIPVESYLSKLNEWVNRTNQFGGLIERPKIKYNIASNTVEAPDSVWQAIERRSPELLVYMHKGEECWSEMRSLFRQLIDISSSSSSSRQRSRSWQNRTIQISSTGTYPGNPANRPATIVISDPAESNCDSDVVDKP